MLIEFFPLKGGHYSWEKVVSYLPRIQANAYWIEKALEKGAESDYEKVIINKLANISYLANQAISDLSKE